jgi:hypothetical protein
MAASIFAHFPVTAPPSQPTKPLPQIPLPADQPNRHVRNCETPASSQHLHGTSIPISFVAAQPFEAEPATQHVSPVSGTQPSVGTPVTSVGSSGKRKGPPEVQWDASKDRKYARLYSLSDADIDDLPIIMRDDTLKFK